MGRAQIPAPPAQGPAYSLELAVPVLDGSGVTWQDGVQWEPPSCAGGGRTALRGCELGLASAWSSSDAATNPDSAVSDPFVVWHIEECSTFPSGDRDMVARARNGLETTRSYWIADALWDGYDLVADDADGEQEQRHLAHISADTLTDGPTAEVAALACLDAGLLRAGRGRRGLVHVTADVLTHLIAASAIWRSGTNWLTAMGNLVVADAGYSGSGPNGEVPGDTQWGYGTGPVRLRMSPLETTPRTLDSEEDRAIATIDAGSDNDNSLRVVAHQLALYEWDACVHVAAEFDVPVCLTGGTS